MAPRYGQPEEVGSGVLRVLCPNPSPMTEHGTNSYLLCAGEEALIVDPGPVRPDHRAALLAALGRRRLVGVAVTHPHLDHSPGARPLADEAGAPVLGFGGPEAGRSETMRRLAGLGGGEGVDADFVPDRALGDGDRIALGDGEVVAIWSPGHMAPHLSFHWPAAEVVLTGDAVMGWASTMISPPDGDLGQFLWTLDRLRRLGPVTALPGHGAPVPDLGARCGELRRHREARAREIYSALAGPAEIRAIVAGVYSDVPSDLRPAAARNVLAHLIHLHEAGRVVAVPEIGPDALWRRND